MAVYLPEHAKGLRMSMEYRHPFRSRAEEYFDEMEPHSDRALTVSTYICCHSKETNLARCRPTCAI